MPCTLPTLATDLRLSRCASCKFLFKGNPIILKRTDTGNKVLNQRLQQQIERVAGIDLASHLASYTIQSNPSATVTVLHDAADNRSQSLSSHRWSWPLICHSAFHLSGSATPRLLKLEVKCAQSEIEPSNSILGGHCHFIGVQ